MRVASAEREARRDSIQENAGGGQSTVHVEFDGIIDGVLTALMAITELTSRSRSHKFNPQA
jgi:hypothetical protein